MAQNSLPLQNTPSHPIQTPSSSSILHLKNLKLINPSFSLSSIFPFPISKNSTFLFPSIQTSIFYSTILSKMARKGKESVEGSSKGKDIDASKGKGKRTSSKRARIEEEEFEEEILAEEELVAGGFNPKLFWSKEVWEEWKRNKWGGDVKAMATTDPSLLGKHDLFDIFHFQNLIGALTLKVDCYKTPTRKFYANLANNSDEIPGLSCFLHGNITPITPEEIHDIVGGHLGEGCINPKNYTLQTFLDEWEDLYESQGEEGVEVVEKPPTIKDISLALTGTPNKHIHELKIVRNLTQRVKILEKIIRFTLIPKDGDKIRMNDSQLVMVVCLLFRVKIDTPNLILDCMLDMHRQKKRTLNFGKVVARLLANRGFVTPPGSEIVQAMWIDATFEGRLLRQPARRDDDDEAHDEEEEADAQGDEGGSQARPVSQVRRGRSMGANANQEILQAISSLERSMSAKYEALNQKVTWMGKLQRKIGKHLGLDVSGFGKCFGMPRKPKADGNGSETDST